MSAITQNAQYSLKPSSVKAKRYTRNIASLNNNSSNSGYSMGDVMIFMLPSGLSNTVADTRSAYLKFTVAFSVTAGGGGAVASGSTIFTPDYTASSIINSISVYGPGGALLEQIDQYNVLANILYDTQYTQSSLVGLSSLIGTADQISNANNRIGYALKTSSSVTASTTTTFYQTFAVPLISGTVGTLAEKYLPLFACTSDDFRIEITLESQVNAFVASSPTNFGSATVTIVQPEIIMDFIEFESSAVEQIKSLYAGRDLVLHSSSFHNYKNTIIDATSGSYQSIIPSKVMSANAMFAVWRRTGVTGVAAGYSLSSFTNPLIAQNSYLRLNVGGVPVPQGKPLTTSRANDVSSYFAELQKGLHGLNDLRIAGTLPMTTYLSGYNVAVGEAPNTHGFIAGINLAQLHGASDTILSGSDLSKVTTYLEQYYTQAITGNQLLDVWIQHDILILVSPEGLVTVKF